MERRKFLCILGALVCQLVNLVQETEWRFVISKRKNTSVVRVCTRLPFSLQCYKHKRIAIQFSSVSSFWVFDQRSQNYHIKEMMATPPMFLAIFSSISKLWAQLTWSSVNKWIKSKISVCEDSSFDSTLNKHKVPCSRLSTSAPSHAFIYMGNTIKPLNSWKQLLKRVTLVGIITSRVSYIK